MLILNILSLKQWLLDSAGTGGHEVGSPIYGHAQKILNKHNVAYKHTARQIKKDDFDKYELILGFDEANMRDLERLRPKTSRAQLHLVNYFNEANKNGDIADPWYPDTDAAFEAVYKDCLASCNAILDTFKWNFFFWK